MPLLRDSRILYTIGIFLCIIFLISLYDSPRAKARGPAAELLESTQNGTLGFEKIFVINLASRTDRKDAMALGAAATGLEVEFVEASTSAERKLLPAGRDDLREAELGNLRSHLNVARTMVQRGIQSALVLEDDADWDIRIKKQMRDFARTTRLLLQPRSDGSYLDPSFPNGVGAPEKPVTVYTGQHVSSDPVDSPYGDLHRWDVLWVGHCGTQAPSTGWRISNGRAALLNDETVPEPHHTHQEWGENAYLKEYANYTRVVHRAHKTICTIGYALTLSGAKRWLHQAGLAHTVGQTDIALRAYCDGDDEYKVFPHMCMTVQPPLFNQYRPQGNEASFSDITAYDEKTNEQAFTRNIRLSTHVNLLKLVEGKTDFEDVSRHGAPITFFGWG